MPLILKLNKSEYDYLCRATFLGDHHKTLLLSARNHGNDRYLVEISKDLADEIRDACGGQLQAVGFDENYELTTEGAILESLVDKFFSGN